MVKDYDGKMYRVKVINGVTTHMMSNEGDVPVKEFIEFLKV
jgi:hypothetical protein